MHRQREQIGLRRSRQRGVQPAADVARNDTHLVRAVGVRGEQVLLLLLLRIAVVAVDGRGEDGVAEELEVRVQEHFGGPVPGEGERGEGIAEGEDVAEGHLGAALVAADPVGWLRGVVELVQGRVPVFEGRLKT